MAGLNRLAGLLAGVVLSSGLLAGARADDSAISNDQITATVKKSVAWIYQQQNAWGTWESARQPTGIQRDLPDQGQFGMQTALATHALLSAGEDERQDRLQSAINFLIISDRIDGVYAVGMRARVWPLLAPTPAVRQAMARDRTILLRAMHVGGRTRGLYSYRTDYDNEPEYADHAVSFYGTLGLKALEDGGIEVPNFYWRVVDRAWRYQQSKDGSWVYQVGAGAVGAKQPHTLSMTACGVAVLFGATDEMAASRPADCQGPPTDKNVEAGLNWIDTHFDRSRDEYDLLGFKLSNFGLYAVARIGAISGRKYFNQRDWYEDGARLLLDSQEPDGSWGNLPDTCFAVLFLERGRNPVVVSKLQYNIVTPRSRTPRPANWNLRPRDMAALTTWVGREFEADYNWQSVSLKVPVEELHDSAVLYMAGNQAPNLAPEDKAKLRTFIQEGGLVLGNADCGAKAFSDGFKRLGADLFPDYEFRNISPDSVIYTHQPFRADKWKSLPQALELNNGVRDLMVLMPQDDPSRFFQMHFIGSRQYLYEFVTDVLLYAVDQNGMRLKGQTYIVRPDPSAQVTRRINVARLEYNGNWDPEPGGWARLAAVMHNTRGVDLRVTPIRLGEGKLDHSFQVAHLTGTAEFHLTDAAAAELKAYVQQGGTVVIDAAGGGQLFDAAAQGQIKAIFPDQPLDVLSSDHPVYSAGESLTHAAYRRFDRSRVSQPDAFRLQGMDAGAGRIGLFYSPEDITEGLVGEPIDGVYGYQPQVATSLMANVIEYAAGQQ